MAGGLRIGTSGWHYASWRGPFYPGALKPADFLAFYGTRFSSAEINNSSYRLPGEEAVAAWREGTPDGFLFAWKASRFITHMKKLRGVEESLDLVFGRMAGLRDKLGPVLFQLPPMLRADRDRLGGFLAILPRGHRVAVEFRHPSWYGRRFSTFSGSMTPRSASPTTPRRRRPGRRPQASSTSAATAPTVATRAITRTGPSMPGRSGSRAGGPEGGTSIATSTTTSRAPRPWTPGA